MLILGTQQCQLVCGNSASAYYFGAVKDGTKCVPNGKDNDVCVQGACKVSLCKKKFLACMCTAVGETMFNYITDCGFSDLASRMYSNTIL